MRIIPWVIFSVVVALIRPVLADETPMVSLAEPVDDIASAKDLNRKGLVLLDAGDYAGALSFFESSRALVRSYANTRNAAVCLDALGRKPETLAMLEALLSDYSDILTADERAIAEKRISELRKELAPIPPPPPPPAPAPSRSSIPSPIPTPVRSIASEESQRENARALGRWSLGGFLGYTTGSSLGSDAEAYVAKNCTTDCPATSGTIAGVRIEYRMPRLVTLEVSGGYLRMDSAFTQSWRQFDYLYSLDIDRTLAGGFIDFGASIRWSWSDRVGLVGRLAIGGTFADVANVTTGIVEGPAGQKGYLMLDADRSSIDGRLAYLRPEVGLEVDSFPYVVSVGVGAFLSMSTGSTFGNLSLRTERSACTIPTLGACAPDLNVSTGNRGYGVFVAFVPQIGVRYHFD